MVSLLGTTKQSALQRACTWWDATSRDAARIGVLLRIIGLMPRCLDEFDGRQYGARFLARCSFADLPPCARHWLQVQARDPWFPLYLEVTPPVAEL